MSSSSSTDTTFVPIKSKLLAEKATWQETFNMVDWTSRDSIITIMPSYIREQYALQRINKKNVSKAVDIEFFTLKTPFGDQTLLDMTPLKLEAGKRQCLYGRNSTGKTLLFTNMVSGSVKEFPKHIHVWHCKELESDELSDTVLGTVVNSHPYRNALLAAEKKLREELAVENLDAARKEKLQENLDWVSFSFNTIRGHDAEERAIKMLRVLGFDDVGMKKPCSALSGGLRMRVALCMAFFIDADLLLLDEPTNHLDFPSVLWLENRLRGYKGSFLIVSHDRELLNNVCTSVILIENKQLNYYNCGFKEFEKRKGEEDKKKSVEIEKFIMKNQNPDPSTMTGRLVHDKKQWLADFQRKQIAMAGKFTFPTPTPLENTEKDAAGNAIAESDISLINLKDVTFSYDVNTGIFIFKDPISFNVTASTRVGVMGPNGAGKSTLLKLLTHKLKPVSGSIVHHPKFNLNYFSQYSAHELNLEETAIEFMTREFPGEPGGVLRNHLGKTGIVGTVADTRMKSLSFSQRACIVFAKLTFICPHLLILDEPTNFLDLESVDSLIAACNKYRGALLLVSHNRDFLRKCAKGYLSVVPGHFNLYDNMKSAEQATYSFIAEMEEGVSVSKTALANNPGGGSVHKSQTDNSSLTEQKSGVEIIGGVKTISIGSSAAAAPSLAKQAIAAKAAADATKAVEKYVLNEKCQALWTDGKWYPAQIKKVDGAKYTVLYTAYGNTVTLDAAKLRKAAAAGGAQAASSSAAKKK